ncbi:MAG: DUF1311 domain-containing protein [Alphaproteobacteria bacterium]|nr:MAG: DUF1311 domain-containing protein [Alphaproteobacteria bacterium]
MTRFLSLLLAYLIPATALAQVRPDDRAAIEACLQSAKDNPEMCIGTIYRPCTDTREGGTTAGMGECAGRETAVWSERIEASLAALMAGSLGQTDAQPHNRPKENRRDGPVKGTDILRDMQATFLIWRAKKCDTLAMQAEGGSLSRVIYGLCTYEETARQALWLKALEQDTAPR